MTLDPASRRHAPDLLARPPSGAREFVEEWAPLLVDPVEQLAVLADLLDRGLLSRPEYERFSRQIRDL